MSDTTVIHPSSGGWLSSHHLSAVALLATLLVAAVVAVTLFVAALRSDDGASDAPTIPAPGETFESCPPAPGSVSRC
jgi:hypothetical protein